MAYDILAPFCDNGNLAVYADGNRSKRVLTWQFPIEFLECFKEVFVLKGGSLRLGDVGHLD